VLSCTRGKKEATCSRTNLMDNGKIPVFTFRFYFLLFQFCPYITHTSFLIFLLETSKTSLTILLPAKIFSILTCPKSSSSSTILTFLKLLCPTLTFAYVIFQFQFVCSGFFNLFCTHMFHGSIWYLIKQFRDLFDDFLI